MQGFGFGVLKANAKAQRALQVSLISCSLGFELFSPGQ